MMAKTLSGGSYAIYNRDLGSRRGKRSGQFRMIVGFEDLDMATRQKMGSRLVELREDRGLDQSGLAALMGIHASGLSRYESGDRQLPTDTRWYRMLAAALGASSWVAVARKLWKDTPWDAPWDDE